MDAATASALAGKAAALNVGYLIVELFVIVGAFAFLILLGEKTLGFDLKRFISNVERIADQGNVMPGVYLLLGVLALLGLVLRVAL